MSKKILDALLRKEIDKQISDQLEIIRSATMASINAAVSLHTEILRIGLNSFLSGEFSANSQEEASIIFNRIISEYRNEVSRFIFATIKQNSAEQYMQVEKCLMYPARCGYPHIQPESLDAGALYAICFFSSWGKIANPNDCMQLAKIQDQIIDNVRKECLEKNAGGKS